MTWLITGGAGYIGAHVVFETLRSGRSAVVLDDLSTGIKERVPDTVPLEVITLTDKAAVNNLFDRHSFSGVLHLAAKKQVGELLGTKCRWLTKFSRCNGCQRSQELCV